MTWKHVHQLLSSSRNPSKSLIRMVKAETCHKGKAHLTTVLAAPKFQEYHWWSSFFGKYTGALSPCRLCSFLNTASVTQFVSVCHKEIWKTRSWCSLPHKEELVPTLDCSFFSFHPQFPVESLKSAELGTKRRKGRFFGLPFSVSSSFWAVFWVFGVWSVGF
jgi:hypothetical protein